MTEKNEWILRDLNDYNDYKKTFYALKTLEFHSKEPSEYAVLSSGMQISLHAMNMIMQVLSKSGQQIGHNSSALLVLKMALLHKGNAYHAALLQLLVLQLRENSPSKPLDSCLQ